MPGFRALMPQKTGQGGNGGCASELGQASEMRGVSKVASSSVISSEWSKHSQMLYQNKTKDTQ